MMGGPPGNGATVASPTALSKRPLSLGMDAGGAMADVAMPPLSPAKRARSADADAGNLRGKGARLDLDLPSTPNFPDSLADDAYGLVWVCC